MVYISPPTRPMKGKAMSQNENLQPETAENTAPQVQDDIELKVLNNADNNNGETTESGCCGVCGG